MDENAAVARVLLEAGSWPGVTSRTHRFGATTLLVHAREIARVLPEGTVEVAFPRDVRNQLVEAGLASPHPLFPHSGWVSRAARSDADASAALALLRRAFDAVPSAAQA